MLKARRCGGTLERCTRAHGIHPAAQPSRIPPALRLKGKAPAAKGGSGRGAAAQPQARRGGGGNRGDTRGHAAPPLSPPPGGGGACGRPGCSVLPSSGRPPPAAGHLPAAAAAEPPPVPLPTQSPTWRTAVLAAEGRRPRRVSRPCECPSGALRRAPGTAESSWGGKGGGTHGASRLLLGQGEGQQGWGEAGCSADIGVNGAGAEPRRWRLGGTRPLPGRGGSRVRVQIKGSIADIPPLPPQVPHQQPADPL